MQPTRHYLLLDQSDPTDPRWVIVRAVLNRRALVPPNLDGPGAQWLDGFRGPQFDWVAEILGPIGVRAPQHGKESYATRLVTDKMIPYEFDRWGHGMGWYAGWSDDPTEWADPNHPTADADPDIDPNDETDKADEASEPADHRRDDGADDTRHNERACPCCHRPYRSPYNNRHHH